jgi:hypothetical protein
MVSGTTCLGGVAGGSLNLQNRKNPKPEVCSVGPENTETEEETTYFSHLASAGVEEMSGYVGMAASICPRADLYGSPQYVPFLRALRNVCASAVLQCSGSTKYRDKAARNRARIAADHQAEGGILEKLNRHVARRTDRAAA